MLEALSRTGVAAREAYIITTPTSGIGLATATEIAGHGLVVLVGRARSRLDKVKTAIEQKGRAAVAKIIALDLLIAGLVNNAGIRQVRPRKNAQGWMTFATNHLGSFALTEALAPHLRDGVNVVFVVSAVEDPDRKPAHAAGLRSGRYISAEAAARGEWKTNGSNKPGFDAYTTSKQSVLASALAFARETLRLRFNAVESGVKPATDLGREAGAFTRFVSRRLVPALVPLLMPFFRFLSTPKRAARVIAGVAIDESSKTKKYYDERVRVMSGSALVCDPKFQNRVVGETRALLSNARTQTQGSGEVL